MICKYCCSPKVHKDGNHNGLQRYKCLVCGKRFDGEEYVNNNSYIIHFNTKLKKTDRNKLTRENYCIPKKEIDYRDKKNIQMAKSFIAENGRQPQLLPQYYCNIPNSIFEDEENYTDEYIEEHYLDCIKNFDLNMRYFESLNYDLFNKYLAGFVKRKRFVEITDLSDVANKIGAYILVLDKYKQVYIGVSSSQRGIKGRILQHWSKQKEFGRLLYGSVETSILSIDSFGALDTTRIFYKELKWYQDLDEYESKVIAEFKSEYCLNRVDGGLNAESDGVLRNLRLMVPKKREL